MYCSSVLAPAPSSFLFLMFRCLLVTIFNGSSWSFKEPARGRSVRGRATDDSVSRLRCPPMNRSSQRFGTLFGTPTVPLLQPVWSSRSATWIMSAGSVDSLNHTSSPSRTNTPPFVFFSGRWTRARPNTRSLALGSRVLKIEVFVKHAQTMGCSFVMGNCGRLQATFASLTACWAYLTSTTNHPFRPKGFPHESPSWKFRPQVMKE